MASEGRNTSALRYLYIATTSLCIWMVVWILVFPSSGLQGLHPTYDRIRDEFTSTAYHIPADLLGKFAGQPAVHWTHTFPSALWSALIPFQIHPGLRSQYPVSHRRLGYVFAATTVLITIGVFLIYQRGLFFEHHNPQMGGTTTPPKSNNSTVGNIALEILGETWTFDPSGVFIQGLGVYFQITALLSIWYARQRRFKDHQRWMIRHIASGLWVAVMRVMLVAIGPFFTEPQPRHVQHSNFGKAGQLGTFISLVMGEYAIHLLDANNMSQLPKKSKIL